MKAPGPEPARAARHRPLHTAARSPARTPAVPPGEPARAALPQALPTVMGRSMLCQVAASNRIALRSHERRFVSAEVADYLDRLRELGVSQRTVQMERDVWILLQSASPDEAAIWIADKRDAIGDPEFRAIYLEYDAAFGWSPDDPRLHALADRTKR